MTIRSICSAILVASLSPVLLSQPIPKQLPPLRVSENHRFLMTADGKPFFYQADTAWELFQRLNRKEAIHYLDVRAAQGFNVIQAVALTEEEGITVPNAYGKLPFIDGDLTRPAVTPGNDPADPRQYDFWDHIDYVINQANARGIYVALWPAWGRWVVNTQKGDKPILTPANATAYGEFLGRRYGHKGVIWILGGDRTPTGFEATWRALARGIAIGVTGKEDYSHLLMSFHPRGSESSSTWFENDTWLSFNMEQNGHNPPAQARPWEKIAADYARKPVKPVLDGESLYEDHPVAFDSKDFGYSFDAQVRLYVYSETFSGAFGLTYGNHAVWQMYAPGRVPINGPLMYWYEAIHRPGAAQMQYLRKLFESRPYFSRVPDQSIVMDALKGADYVSATRGNGYLFVYSAQGRKFTVRPKKISGKRLKGWWYNPRSGDAIAIGTFSNNRPLDFTCPSEGFGSDWVLVLDDASKSFPRPGGKFDRQTASNF